MSAFTTPLEIEYIDGRNWCVTSEFDYHVGAETSLEYIRVHKGFVTDFASTPRILWNILPPTGPYGKAAVIHDMLYREGWPKPPDNRYTRAQCDAIFREAMQVLGTPWLERWIMWLGVRLGGARSYRTENPSKP